MNRKNAIFSTGDVNSLEYGGGVVYYQPEYDEILWVFWDEPNGEPEESTYRTYAFSFDPNQDILKNELDWVGEDVPRVEETMGMSKGELKKMAKGDVIDKLMVAENVRDYWGAENLDSYPVERSYKEMEKDFGSLKVPATKKAALEKFRKLRRKK